MAVFDELLTDDCLNEIKIISITNEIVRVEFHTHCSVPVKRPDMFGTMQRENYMNYRGNKEITALL